MMVVSVSVSADPTMNSSGSIKPGSPKYTSLYVFMAVIVKVTVFYLLNRVVLWMIPTFQRNILPPTLTPLLRFHDHLYFNLHAHF
jgi:hypothetical protein